MHWYLKSRSRKGDWARIRQSRVQSQQKRANPLDRTPRAAHAICDQSQRTNHISTFNDTNIALLIVLLFQAARGGSSGAGQGPEIGDRGGKGERIQ